MLFGFLNIHKPAAMTSHDVVARIRRLTGIKQVGHAGTLDPMAVGVLPIAVGAACRFLRFLTTDKVYLAEVLVGTRTDTDDLDGAILKEEPLPRDVQERLPAIVASLIGAQKQIPPMYSAIHHGGKRLYELARAGNAPKEVAPRDVTIQSIEILSVELPVVKLRVACSGGTYIRAIARDIGEQLGCGACLKALTREKSGPFLLADAYTLDALSEMAAGARVIDALVPPEKALAMDILEVERTTAESIAMGQYVRISTVPSFANLGAPSGKVCLVMFNNSLIGLCQITEDGRLHPEVVVGHAKSLV
jgi:tRNA pseudouridine55 synthase